MRLPCLSRKRGDDSRCGLLLRKFTLSRQRCVRGGERSQPPNLEQWVFFHLPSDSFPREWHPHLLDSLIKLVFPYSLRPEALCIHSVLYDWCQDCDYRPVFHVNEPEHTAPRPRSLVFGFGNPPVFFACCLIAFAVCIPATLGHKNGR